MHEILETYINGNLYLARDLFWTSSKLQMRNVMLEANDYYEHKDDLRRFIRIIFLP